MIYYLKIQKTAKQLTFISLGALFLGHLMEPPIILLNIVGILLVSIFVFYYTLRNNDVFSFIMVIYFCSLFKYLSDYGGGFNLIAFFSIMLFIAIKHQLPFNSNFNNKWLNGFIVILVSSSILGWFTNYAGNNLHLIFSVLSFCGVISILFVSSRLQITRNRIIIFLQLNFVLIIYSTIASLNKYLKIITFQTPMMPIYGSDNGSYIEGGGIIGSSPLYGEHSMILVLLFAVFLILGEKKFGNNRMLLMGVFISLLNVFMSISRSVFILSLIGLIMIYIFQFRITTFNLAKSIKQIVLIGLFGIVTLISIEYSGLGYVFNRVEEYKENNNDAGGSAISKIIDGSAFGRKESFDLAYERYASKKNWIIGYGWGTREENRIAFYVDTKIEQDSVHTQIFAVLFLFGWLGFIAYLLLYFWIILKSYAFTGLNPKGMISNRLFAFFSMIMLIMFLLNEIKADSISFQSYFGSTIIFLGLAYANLNSLRNFSNHSNYVKNRENKQLKFTRFPI